MILIKNKEKNQGFFCPSFFLKTKKGQAAMEFLIVFGAMLFFFVIFFGIIQENISEKDQEKERIVAQSVALDVQDEINLAAESSEGYFRGFSIPENILGKEYQINVTQGRILISFDKFSASYNSRNVSGIIKKGLNEIKKENGTVYLN